jgi:hypothetical protein
MSALDPKALFARIAEDLPRPIQRHVFIVGSLAAAYHFRTKLEGRAVNTKDADLVVHPAGDVRSAKRLAVRLLKLGWRRTPECYPASTRSPAEALRAIRLYPPKSQDYFLELLGLPAPGQSRGVVWVGIRLSDGWYGVGCHRFMRLNAFGRLKSSEGLEYAAPSMMALANLLSHSEVGPQRMSAPIAGRKILRSAKDLGRVLALAWLSGREQAERWLESWRPALRESFPKRWPRLAEAAGSGLEQLLADPSALEEARVTTDVGLLNGRGVTAENLAAVGRQLMSDVLRPLAGSR